VEASLEAREAKVLQGWHTLQQQAVALRGLMHGKGGDAAHRWGGTAVCVCVCAHVRVCVCGCAWEQRDG